MTFRLQIILLVLWILIFVFLVSQMRKKVLEIKYTLSWLLLDVVLIFVTIFPQILVFVTDKLGILTPINMIFFLGFIFALLIIYTLTVSLSHMSDRVRLLTQRIALDEYKEKTDLEKDK